MPQYLVDQHGFVYEDSPILAGNPNLRPLVDGEKVANGRVVSSVSASVEDAPAPKRRRRAKGISVESAKEPSGEASADDALVENIKSAFGVTD